MLTQLSPSRIAALTIAALISILAFTGTAGAQIIGSKCASNSGAPTTLFTTATASGESYVVPFDGVLTEWGTDRTHAGANEGVVAALLGAKSGSDWTVVGSTGFQYIPANSGAVSYAARISVGAGQTLGTTTFNTMPVMCETGSPLDIGGYGSAYGTGESFTETPINNYKASIWANIEPDADKDGFGDETQDKCPQSAMWQNPCPVLSLSQQLSASNKQINILASSSIDSQLVAVAVVSIPKIGKTKAKRVTITGKPTAFTAGKLKTIKLKLPSSVKSALKKKGKLNASVTLSGTGLANTATATGKVRLKK